ncbi:MAG TPA: nucleotidyltransferase domain-containing protein [Polyangiaceae bacterium]
MESALAEQTIANYFQDKPGIAAVYLFGSVARGTAGPESDVDIGVLYQVPPAPTLLDQPFSAEADLAELLGRPVQIVVMNGAPADLVHRILRDSVLISEPNKSRRIAFEVRSRNEYFDLLPLLREYRKRASS